MADDKIFRFRGMTMDELKMLPTEEFIKLLDSSKKRKFSRGLTEPENKLLKKLRSKEKNIKTHCREMIVLPEMIGEKISIHNGKEFVQIHLVDEMIGLKFGELAPTRKIGVQHSGGGAKKSEVRK